VDAQDGGPRVAEDERQHGDRGNIGARSVELRPHAPLWCGVERSRMTPGNGDRPNTGEATVLVADIAGFTTLSERLDPETVTSLMNGCFGSLEHIVEGHGGEVRQLVGDAVYAVFPHDDDPRRAASSALAAAGQLEDAIALVARTTGATGLGIHAGVATGQLWLGADTSDGRHLALLMGPALDRALALDAGASNGMVRACDRTRALGVLPIESPPLPGPMTAAPAATLAQRPSERRQATILFVTLDARTLDSPADLAHLADWLAIVESAGLAWGGTLDKFLGAGAMLLFGVPGALEGAPRQAVNAAIEMRRRLGEAGGPAVRIGLNTGLVVAGYVGGRRRRDYTVMGDTVNVAARIRSAAPANGIWLGPVTAAGAGADFEFQPMAPMALKGRAEPLAIVDLRSTRERLGRRRGRPSAAGNVAGPYVGRERELAQIGACVDDVLAGRGGVALIAGAAGLGKSRLLAEALASPAVTSCLLLEGHAVSVGHGLPFHPFTDLLRRWAGIEEQDDDPTSERKLDEALAAAAGAEAPRLAPFVAALAGVRGAASEDVAEEMIYFAMRELLQQLASDRPVVFVIEDVHWADRSSLGLLERLVPVAARHPVLFVLGSRFPLSEGVSQVVATARLAVPDRCVELPLAELSDTDGDRLVRQALGDDVPPAVRARLVAKAGGNPYFLEELFRALLDQGAVVRRGRRLRVTPRIHEARIPDTIQELILGRVDRLPDPARRALQAAAVIGRAFPHRVLTALADDPNDLDAILEQLVALELLRVHRPRRAGGAQRTALPPDEEYAFTHALLQETVYEALLQATRRELHGRVAAILEQLFANRLPDYYGMLAFHFSQAGDTEKAEKYLLEAGEDAARAAASDEALAFFEDAFRLYVARHGTAGESRTRARLERNIAMALLNKGRLAESIAHFDQSMAALGEPRPARSMAVQGRFVRHLAGTVARLYGFPRGMRRVDDWEREREIFQIIINRGRAEITSDPTRLFFDTIGGMHRLLRIDSMRVEQASAICASGATVFAYSGISFAISHRMLKLAWAFRRPGLLRDSFPCATMEFILRYLEGDWEAAPVDEPILAAAIEDGQLWDANTYLGLLCDRQLRRGEFAGARRSLERLDDLAESYGFDFAAGNRDGMTALLLAEQRRLDEALPAVAQYLVGRHEDPLRAFGLGTQAKIQILRGDLAAAEDSLAGAEAITNRSREIAPWQGSAPAVARLHLESARLAADRTSRSRIAAARRAVRAAVGMSRRIAIQRPETYRLIGTVAWSRNRLRTAIRWWERSVATATAMGQQPELARAYATAAHHLQTAGHPGRVAGADGVECARRAQTVFRALDLAS
jgi:class 3 adenylate cyclase/tetratricopeptide (TPR) repeat protein